MNVEKGDMAVVIWPGKVANNHFVDVLDFIPPGTPANVGGQQYRGISDPAWWVRCASPVRARTGELISEFPVRDANLRPIGKPGKGGVEETSFQKPIVTTKTETLQQQIAALNEARKYRGSQA